MVMDSSCPPHLIRHSLAPLNAEPTLPRLRSAFLTRTEDFYIRSHGLVPEIVAGEYKLHISGLVKRPTELSIDDLKSRFPARRITAVLQCAGNRRADMQPVKPTAGDPWAAGAIGNAEWEGVPLAEVLRFADAGLDSGLHVALTAADMVENEGAASGPYEVSIPLSKALAPEVLLAWAMNGEPLRSEHGAPLRLVVPGYVGARSVKWLAEIRVQDRPSEAFQQRYDYLLFPPDMEIGTQDISRGMVINEMPLNSAICEPCHGATLPAGTNAVRGYAVATGREIVRVEVSADGGHTWQEAVLEDHGPAPWSWTLWRAEVDLAPGDHEIIARAWDSAGKTQPAEVEEVWNFRGYLCTAWHRVGVKVPMTPGPESCSQQP